MPALILTIAFALAACHNNKTVVVQPEPRGPQFAADSAYTYCQAQCDFGPRTMNSEAHDACRDWIVSEFQRHGCTVELQQADLKGYDGTMLRASNIIASYTPAALRGKADAERILLCAHYDSRPWADNDPNPDNHHTPVMAANDGASGVAVMLEVARLLQIADSAKVGVDFVCFDAEDYGTPQWYEGESQIEDPWALGAQYWSANPRYNIDATGNAIKPLYGVLLDMVGGEGAVFYEEGMSLQYARKWVNHVWNAASEAGYGQMFSSQQGGYITDDHVPVNTTAGIPCIDIIPYYPNCQQSSFGPTWHTIDDNMTHISTATLEGVGQTLIQLIY